MLIVKIGGPAYRIGMGGGAASSVPSGSNAAELDFNAVQARGSLCSACQRPLHANFVFASLEHQLRGRGDLFALRTCEVSC